MSKHPFFCLLVFFFVFLFFVVFFVFAFFIFYLFFCLFLIFFFVFCLFLLPILGVLCPTGFNQRTHSWRNIRGNGWPQSIIYQQVTELVEAFNVGEGLFSSRK